MIGREAPDWVARYVGLSFADHGRGPQEFDCWGLVRHVLHERFALPLEALPDHGAYQNPTHGATVASMFDEGLAQNWHRVEQGHELGDILVACRPVRVDSKLAWLPFHVGLVVGRSLMLHIEKDRNAVLERFDKAPWHHRIEGIYRHVSYLGGVHG